jgi:hypothetical protein
MGGASNVTTYTPEPPQPETPTRLAVDSDEARRRAGYAPSF